ncbi:hypothetical protein Pelo_17867 [Pelomyxa schiedti]|nr:hypothetical protein Pelo_17867 [Pelomyxa schiedti]
MCWLGCDRFLTSHWEGPDRLLQVVDVAHYGRNTSRNVVGSNIETSGCLLFWGTHKWILMWKPGELLIHRVAQLHNLNGSNTRSCSLHPLIPPQHSGVDVVFSHSEPSLIEDGNEASIIALFDHDCSRFLFLTVDLEKSFAISSLVVVNGPQCHTTPKGTCCTPALFMDESGQKLKVVYTTEVTAGGYVPVFSLTLKTGTVTKLKDRTCGSVTKESDQMVGLDFECRDLFSSDPADGNLVGNHLLPQRGLTVCELPCTAGCRAVRDTMTGVTLSAPTVTTTTTPTSSPPSTPSSVGQPPATKKHKRQGRVVAVKPLSRSTETQQVSVTQEDTRGGRSAPATTTLTTTATTTTREWTAREQMAALAAGTHPRCGAACPLRATLMVMVTAVMGSSSAAAAAILMTGCGGDGVVVAYDTTLVLRVLWAWLMRNARFFCVMWGNNFAERGVVMTFGVSPLLLTLTHEMKWRVEKRTRPSSRILGANEHFLVVQTTRIFYIQDLETGQKTLVFDTKKPRGRPFWNACTKGKWLVTCDVHSQRGGWKLFIIELPKKNRVTSAAASSGSPIAVTIKKPTVVSLNSIRRRNAGCVVPQFLSYSENCMLLKLYERGQQLSFLQFVLIDLVQTISTGKLIVLSSTIPQLHMDHCDCLGRITNVSTGNRLIVKDWAPYSDYSMIFSIEEGTGKEQPLLKHFLPMEGSCSQLDDSRLCIFGLHQDASYDVLNVTTNMNTAHEDDEKPTPLPHREAKKSLLPGCTFARAFVEGGLLFQMSESLDEMHVSDERSGAHVITFQLFRPLAHYNFLTEPFSFVP